MYHGGIQGQAEAGPVSFAQYIDEIIPREAPWLRATGSGVVIVGLALNQQAIWVSPSSSIFEEAMQTGY